MAGAYRCPVCGVDFPAGTPGAPRATTSSADPQPRRRAASTKAFAEDLGAALGDALDIGEGDDEPAAPAHEAPSRRHDNAEPDEARDRERRAESSASLDVRPREVAATGGSASLTVRPAREGSAVTPAGPARTVPVTTRRNRSSAMAGTILTGLLVIVAAAAGYWYLGNRLPTAAIGVAAPAALSVGADDGWVRLPSSDGPLVVTADGPFRVRVDGDVYTVDGARSVRIPQGSRASVRVVRAPSRAEVRTAQ